MPYYYQKVEIEALIIDVALIASYFPEFRHFKSIPGTCGSEEILDFTKPRFDRSFLTFTCNYGLGLISKTGFRSVASNYTSLELAVLFRRLPAEVLAPLKKALKGTELEIPDIADDYQLPESAIITLPDEQPSKKIFPRKLLLEQLAQQTSITCCVGLAGIGKTELAVQYARDENSFFHKLLFRATDKQTLISSYHQFIADYFLRNPKLSNDEAVAFVLDWFDKHSKWLVIYDGIENYDLLEDLIPIGGKGRIILTSCVRPPLDWQKKFHIDVISIDCMSEVEATELVNFHLRGYSEWNTKIPELIQLMTGHPAALIQATKFIVSSEIKLTKYISGYKRQPVYYLDEPKNKSVYRAIRGNIDLFFHPQRREKDSEYARSLLQFCSYSKHEYISFEAIEAWEKISYPISPNCLKRILYDLHAYSLVQFDNGLGIRINPLVHLAIRQSFSKEEQAAKSAIALAVTRQFDLKPVSVQVVISYKENPHFDIYQTPLRSLRVSSWLGYDKNGDNTIYLNSPNVCYILISELTEATLPYIFLLEPGLQFRVIDEEDFRPAKKDQTFFPAVSLRIGRVLSKKINELPEITASSDVNFEI